MFSYAIGTGTVLNLIPGLLCTSAVVLLYQIWFIFLLNTNSIIISLKEYRYRYRFQISF